MKLPDIVPNTNSYNQMFKNCENLSAAPTIHIGPEGDDCYDAMFYDCNNLQIIKVDFENWNDTSNINTTNWVIGVKQNGTFYCPSELPVIYDENHIPNGWTVVNT